MTLPPFWGHRRIGLCSIRKCAFLNYFSNGNIEEQFPQDRRINGITVLLAGGLWLVNRRLQNFPVCNKNNEPDDYQGDEDQEVMPDSGPFDKFKAADQEREDGCTRDNEVFPIHTHSG